jgi:hypothetical protein
LSSQGILEIDLGAKIAQDQTVMKQAETTAIEGNAGAADLNRRVLGSIPGTPTKQIK